MRSTTFLAAVAATTTLSFPLGATAQTPKVRNGVPSQPLSVTGCLRATSDLANTPGPVATAGKQPSPLAGQANVSMVLVRAGVEPSGPIGTSGTVPAWEASPSYKLIADDARLNWHVDHVVEIVGSIQQPAGTNSVAPSKPATSASAIPVLKVESIRTLSLTCSE